MFVDELKSAFARLVSLEEHNLLSISRKSGVNNSTVNRLNSKKADFSNIPALTIQRLFPEMRVYFFRTDYPRDAGIMVTGPNTGPIASGVNANATVRIGQQPDPVADESTKMLLSYWNNLPASKRFEFLMQLAREAESKEKK